MPSKHFDDIIDKAQSLVGHDGVILGHGHIGDGNLHLNCAMKGFDCQDLVKRV